MSFKHTSVITDHWSGRSYCGWISSLLARSHQTTFPKRLANIFVHWFYIAFLHISVVRSSLLWRRKVKWKDLSVLKKIILHIFWHILFLGGLLWGRRLKRLANLSTLSLLWLKIGPLLDIDPCFMCYALHNLICTRLGWNGQIHASFACSGNALLGKICKQIGFVLICK